MARPRPTVAAALAPAAAAALVILPILYVHRQSFRTFISAHGLLHSAVAERFLATTLVPGRPENPFFAGEAIRYYWPFHYAAAAITAVTQLHPLYAFETLIAASVAVLWFVASGLGRRLYGTTVSGLAVGFLALAGANPLGAAMLLGKMVVRGAEVTRDNPDYLRGVVHPMLGVARYRDPNSLYGPVLIFFFNISSRPLALAAILGVLLALLVSLHTGRRSPLFALAGAIAVCAASNFLVGVSSGIALLLGLVIAWWLGTDRAERAESFPRVVRAAATILAGLILAAPTYYYFFLESQGTPIRLHLSGWVLARAGLTAGPVAIAALVGVLRSGGIARAFLLACTVAGGILIAGSTLLALPVGNEHNLANAATIILAIPAVGCFAPGVHWPRTMRRASWGAMLLLFLPTCFLVIYSYLDRPPIALALEGRHVRRVPPGSPLARMYAWIDANTPIDAVFIIDPRHVVAAGGNVPELPALTRRVLFAAPEDNYMVAPYPDAAFRQALAVNLFKGGSETARESTYLTALRRPIYLAASEADPAANEAWERRYGAPAFRDGTVAVFRIR